MQHQQKIWPSSLWIIRHGQSSGNVARDAAEAAGVALIDIASRDIDTPLSDLGIAQSQALGRWFAAMAPDEKPEVLLCSPYLRARDTAKHLMEHAALNSEHVVVRYDERLREKEFGILDRLTSFGIAQKHPDLKEQRAHVGKFYFRPPGGESWCDVILRLRSLNEMMSREYASRRVLVIGHQVIVNCMRYLLENMDEKTILEIDAKGDIPNCGVTLYRFDRLAEGAEIAPALFNFVAPLEASGTAVTKAPDVPAGPKP